MDKHSIAQQLTDCPWQDKIQVFDLVDSTNTMLKALGAQGAPEGTVIIADRQTGGRGRLGRTFLSPGGVGIYLSALLRPNCRPQELMHLTCAAAVAMCDAVEAACGFRPGIKWTNDLVHGTKKLGGILTELGLDPRTGLVSYAVIGIGINCGQTAADFDESIRDMATSVRMVTGHSCDRSALAAAMVRALEQMNTSLLTRRTDMLAGYKSDCITLGRHISVVRGDCVRHGTAVDIDDEGGLIVRYDQGDVETVTSGEVSIRGLYGYIS